MNPSIAKRGWTVGVDSLGKKMSIGWPNEPRALLIKKGLQFWPKVSDLIDVVHRLALCFSDPLLTDFKAIFDG